MFSKQTACLYIAIFSTGITLYLLLPFILPGNHLLSGFDVSQNMIVNFLFHMLIFLLVPLILAGAFNFICSLFSSRKRNRVRLGEILVANGLITEAQLVATLAEQRLRFGEVLVDAGRISGPQLDFALEVQKRTHMKLGEILIDLGYLAEKDVYWVLNRIGRKIGKILFDRDLISEYDLACALSQQACRMDAKPQGLAQEK
ncbi:hypothetical protein ACFLZL_02450 [Thermodesulfobacteriota bacterium]